MAKKSYFELLGVGEDASAEEIQVAYERAQAQLGQMADTEDGRNRLVFLQHARDSILDSRKRALRSAVGKGNPSPTVRVPTGGINWWLVWIVAGVLGYALAWWTAKPVVVPIDSSPVENRVLQARAHAIAAPAKSDEAVGSVVSAIPPSDDLRPAAGVLAQNRTDPRFARLRELLLRSDTMFDVREEIYRIANIGGIRLQDIQFDADETKAHSVAWAMPTLERKERFCSIRIARAYGQDRLGSGAKITAFESTRYKAILAHELSHCLDWYETGLSGWRIHGNGLFQPADLSPTDVGRRWAEEFADLHAIHLLKLAYGQEVAQDAAQIIVLERKRSNHVSYRHSWIPVERGSPLGINSSADAHKIVARFWMQ